VAPPVTNTAVDSFAGKLAVVTGGGSGIGRELVRQLAAEGCSVAACDVNPDSVAVTAATAWAAGPPGIAVTGHVCDVSDEAQVLRFRDELLAEHSSDHVDLVFSNAGIGGGGSFVNASRQEWERTFAVDWWGVYYCARAFLPLLIASGDGVLVNTSSLNGLWASLGPGKPNSAYSTAKFAVRGFTEALIDDLRTNAPQVRVAVVLSGSVGAGIVAKEIVAKERALLSAPEAAAVILGGVRSGAWRILAGNDAAFVDERVRSRPEAAYDYPELFKDLPADFLRGAADLPEGARNPLPEWIRSRTWAR
jgi:NAD(P)-dependent dehydrogenase (short-subunit alcohol dehydrogenase family)